MHINIIYIHIRVILNQEKSICYVDIPKKHIHHTYVCTNISVCVCTIIQQGRRQARMPRVLYLDVHTVVTFEHWLERPTLRAAHTSDHIVLSQPMDAMVSSFWQPINPNQPQSVPAAMFRGTRLASVLPLVSGRPWSFLQLSCGGWFRLPLHRGEDLQGKVWL